MSADMGEMRLTDCMPSSNSAFDQPDPFGDNDSGKLVIDSSHFINPQFSQQFTFQSAAQKSQGSAAATPYIYESVLSQPKGTLYQSECSVDKGYQIADSNISQTIRTLEYQLLSPFNLSSGQLGILPGVYERIS